MTIDIITLFPNMFRGPFEESILQRAQERGLVTLRLHNLRSFTCDKHQQVDDYPYGGGPGMVLKPEPIARAIRSLTTGKSTPVRVVFLTPQGERLTQQKVNALSLEPHLILLCGRYKGIDERIRQRFVTDELSIGDYVLSGGELAAMVLVDTVVRLLPGALSDAESALDDSFQNGLLDCPWYTRPEEFEGMRVPDVLSSGHHEHIRQWRWEEALRRTRERRPDLLETFQTKEESKRS